MRGALRSLVVACFCTGMVAMAAAAASARDYQAGAVKVVDPWTRATPPNAEVAGGFMSIINTGTTPDRLVGGASPVAARLEVHEMTMAGGVMQMHALSDGLALAPGATTVLKPVSYTHLTLPTIYSV